MSSVAAWTAILTMNSGDELIVIRVPKEYASNRALAQKVINALRVRVPLDRMALEVVVLGGDFANKPNIFGSASAAEAHVRERVGQLSNCRWQLIKLDC